MLIPIFTLKLNQKVIPRTVTVGNYDGKHPSLTAATSAGKVFLHNPHASHQSGGRMQLGTTGEVSYLNINQTITAVCAGPLNPNRKDRDTLVVGTPTNVLAYDVDDNADLFYKEAADGANAITIGKLGDIEGPLAIVGGNCSLQGFDYEGNDPFWTVTGDNVCSLCLVDFKQQGRNNLIVGSEDYDIRVFNEDEIIAEMTETDAISCLCPMRRTSFGYALTNGTVGVYDRTDRSWRIKSKNPVTCICSYDLNSDGVPELITGWSNGKIDARSDRTGEVIYKDSFSAAVAGIVTSDYKQDGKEQLICCSIEGEVRGYQSAPSSLQGNLMGANLDQDAIRDLSTRKQNLLMELGNYAENQRAAETKSTSSFENSQMDIIPANTQLQSTLYADPQDSFVTLLIATSNKTVIRSVLVFAEGIFEGESHVLHPKETDLNGTVKIPIRPPKDIPVDLHVKAFIGNKQSVHQFHVFELTRSLPRFSMYVLVTDTSSITRPESGITFTVKERMQRVVMWVNQNFLLDEDLTVTGNQLEVMMVCQRTKLPLVISIDPNSQVSILIDNMDTAGDILQSLAGFLNIEDLNVQANFPAEMTDLADILSKVDEYHSVRQKLTSDMADHSNLIKGMIVRAEDARLMDDIISMKKYYMELYDLNRDLINGYKIRCNNHTELLNYLRKMNQYIQRAGKLRVGKYKTQVIADCRAAVKNNNISSLFKIIKTGGN